MSRFEVDSAQVESAAGAVRGSAAVIGSEVDRMARHLQELQAAWKGQAASQFQAVAENWRATQERVKQNLEEVSAALAAAGATYADAESANLRMFAG